MEADAISRKVKKYLYKDDPMPEIQKWTATEKSINYFRECAMTEMLHEPTFVPGDPHQEHHPERVRCTPSLWRQLTRMHQKRMPTHQQECMSEGKEDPFYSNRLVGFMTLSTSQCFSHFESN